MAEGWLTHLATNGAGTIHDWEYSWLGRSTESVRDGVAHGTLRHLGRNRAANIHLALLAGGVDGEGYGRAWAGSSPRTARRCPRPTSLAEAICREPAHPLTAARAELLRGRCGAQAARRAAST